MGLDMYLYAKRYLSPYVDGADTNRQKAIQDLFPELDNLQERSNGRTDLSPVKQVFIEIGYWRKANAIHKWFVENVQENKDDCGDYYVDREQLQSLRKLCMEVLTNRGKAEEILPTASGFFFGSTNYDEWFFDGLEDTVRIIDNCLSLPNGWSFEYTSSW